MSALQAGVRAPEMKLNYLDGRKFVLTEALKSGPVVAAFFKVSCPVCQYAFPYYERMFKAYGKSGRVTFVGISQDDAENTAAFNQQFGVTFPALLDLQKEKYPVSSAYGLTNVPTIFLISADGGIEFSCVSWSKPDMEELAGKLAEFNGAASGPFFPAGEKVAEFKPG
jgi:peroxiredoxin